MKNPESIMISKPAPVRGKYAHLLERGTNVAILDPDVVEHFPDSASVNNALRAFLAIGKEVESASAVGSRKTGRASTQHKSIFDPLKRRSIRSAATATK